jgi:hypothetical protein
MPAAPAHAAAGCWGAGCTGKIASTMGCVSGAIPEAGFASSDNLVQLTLFYSPACHAAWAEDAHLDGSPAKAGAPNPLDLQVWHQAANGGPEAPMNDTVDAASTLSTIDTPMVDWDESVKLCTNYSGHPEVDPIDNPGGGSSFVAECTSWR